MQLCEGKGRVLRTQHNQQSCGPADGRAIPLSCICRGPRFCAVSLTPDPREPLGRSNRHCFLLLETLPCKKQTNKSWILSCVVHL